MDLEDKILEIKQEIALFLKDLDKCKVVKTAAKRSRVKSMKLQKLFKDFRKLSLDHFDNELK